MNKTFYFSFDSAFALLLFLSLLLLFPTNWQDSNLNLISKKAHDYFKISFYSNFFSCSLLEKQFPNSAFALKKEEKIICQKGVLKNPIVFTAYLKRTKYSLFISNS